MKYLLMIIIALATIGTATSPALHERELLPRRSALIAALPPSAAPAAIAAPGNGRAQIGCLRRRTTGGGIPQHNA